MPDDRSSGLNSRFVSFKGLDSNASAIPNKKNSRDQNSGSKEDKDKDENNEHKESEFMDRSAQLRASLNSLAMLNVVNVIKKNDPNNKTKKTFTVKNIFKEDLDNK